ncbi:tRNA 2-selenouridine synthase [Candidatus Arthromitus sp. SFB-rat-Yit]|nr:tRNA 2-selenouridine synthase [Candidatus Arthromitus sp. SFB-rat-Yit]
MNMDNVCVIDVRSEDEFKNGTISGAINIPILNNKEREEVGFTYVNKSVCDAKRLALRYAGYKLEDIFNKVSEVFENNKEIVFFCARGGMRSLTVHNLFNSIGIKNYKLDMGYKGYRKFLRENFENYLKNIRFIVIHGKTGIGKTKILKELKTQGYPVIDLERAANHRASFLGGVNLGEQNSQKNFESIIFHDILEIIKTNKCDDSEKIHVFIEGESKRIGKIIIPEYFFKVMNEGIHVYVDLPIQIRVENLIADYLKVSLSEIKNRKVNIDSEILKDFKESMNLLDKYSNKNNMEEYRTLFKNAEYERLAEVLIMNYYDPKYLNSMGKHNFEFKFELNNLNEFLIELKGVYKLLKK